MKAQNETKAHKVSRVTEMYRFIVGLEGSLGCRLIRVRGRMRVPKLHRTASLCFSRHAPGGIGDVGGLKPATSLGIDHDSIG